jgi:hypothetical protein
MQVPHYAALRAAEEFYWGMMPLVILRRALRGWTGPGLPDFSRQRGQVPAVVIDELPPGDIMALGNRAWLLTYLPASAGNGSGAPSPAPETPTPSAEPSVYCLPIDLAGHVLLGDGAISWVYEDDPHSVSFRPVGAGLRGPPHRGATRPLPHYEATVLKLAPTRRVRFLKRAIISGP